MTGNMKCWLLFILSPFVIKVQAQILQANHLLCQYHVDPIGIDVVKPILNWQLTSRGFGIHQTAYRVLVADDSLALADGKGNVWDPGKKISSQSIQIPYDGSLLQPAKTYFWKVMVWDNKRNVSAWSKIAKWQMGLFTKTDWKDAKWIAYEKMPDSLLLKPDHSEQKRMFTKDVLPIFRKEFSLQKQLAKATVFIAGLGHFDLSVNGKKAGDHFLDAGWTDYDKHALYVTFDVTTMLKQGKNAMGVMLGNGFYFTPGERYLKLQLAYGYPKMICRVLLEYADGSSDNIVSDPSWKTAPGPITFSSIYGGEDYDARLEQAGWDSPSFNESAWKASILVDGPAVLEAQTATPVKIFDHFTTKKITQPKPGVWVYDLGQNASGIPSISVKGKKGDKIRLWPSELCDKEGLITTEPIGTPVYFEYTLKGDGIETWQPRFMYYGFRYVQIKGGVPKGENNPDGLPVVETIMGLHTRNAAPVVGSFNCSNELFNKTFSLIDWGVKSNMSSVLTDCPHREKLGWLEEAHLMLPSIGYNYDVVSLCRKIIRDMMYAQTTDGLIPSTAPEFGKFGGPFRDSPEWGSNSIIMPWYLYKWYGDGQILEEAYPMMQRYVAYLGTKAKNGILSYGLGDWYDIGPKPPGPSQLTPNGITATAFYYYDLTIMSNIASILGKKEDVENYKNLAETIKATYNKTFFNKETKQYGKGSQTANAISVYMQLVEPEYKEAVIDNMIKELRSHNNSLTAGDIGYRYLLRVLDENGHSDVIYDMNSNPDVPGYGYQLARGATALTESWQAYTNASNNHMMLGHLMEWFYSGLAGIKPANNSIAFNKIEISPALVGDVNAAKASYNSPYGIISSDWKKTERSFELTVEIPVNTTATIFLPATKTSKITESKKALSATNGRKILRYENGYALVEIGSGLYHFKVE